MMLSKTAIGRAMPALALTLALAAPALAETDPKAAALLPQDIASAGVLKVVTSLAYPPMEFTDP
ncbi:hypothetical protein, partial [Paracoccus litorisediminis]